MDKIEVSVTCADSSCLRSFKIRVDLRHAGKRISVECPACHRRSPVLVPRRDESLLDDVVAGAARGAKAIKDGLTEIGTEIRKFFRT